MKKKCQARYYVNNTIVWNIIKWVRIMFDTHFDEYWTIQLMCFFYVHIIQIPIQATGWITHRDDKYSTYVDIN